MCLSLSALGFFKVNETLLRSIVTQPSENNYWFAKNFSTLDVVARAMLFNDTLCNKPSTSTTVLPTSYRTSSSTSTASKGQLNIPVNVTSYSCRFLGPATRRLRPKLTGAPPPTQRRRRSALIQSRKTPFRVRPSLAKISRSHF